MSELEEVVRVLKDVLQLGDRALSFTRDTPLLGSVPEFDSMAVVSVITALEETYGFVVDDDDVDATVFETVGNLTDFVTQKMSG